MKRWFSDICWPLLIILGMCRGFVALCYMPCCRCYRKEMKICAVRVHGVETLNHTRQSRRTLVSTADWINTVIVAVVAVLNVSNSRPQYVVTCTITELRALQGLLMSVVTTRSELRKVLFLVPSVCVFLFVYEISLEQLTGFVPNSNGRRVSYLTRTHHIWRSRSKVKVTIDKNDIFWPFWWLACSLCLVKHL